jgi:hypothetical protein
VRALPKPTWRGVLGEDQWRSSNEFTGCTEIIVTKFGKGSAGARVERHAGSLVMENILNAAGVLEDREFQAALRLHSAGMSKRC